MLPTSDLARGPDLPDALSALLQTLDGKVSSVEICRSLIANLPGAQPALGAALLDIADAADRSGLGNAYHNPVHSRDVGVIFVNLIRLQALLPPGSDLSPIDVLTGCCAAFGHDIGHDGIDGGPEPQSFRLERIAADAVAAIMESHGVAKQLVERARCAILATDVHGGYRALEQAQRGMVSTSGDMPASLHALGDPATHEMACLLRDADVMQSAGLTPDDHDRQTARLEEERGIPAHSMGARGADFFLKDVIRGHFLSRAGRVFQPRLDRLLRLNALRAKQAQGSRGLASFDRG